jgi:hypothetical protein
VLSLRDRVRDRRMDPSSRLCQLAERGVFISSAHMLRGTGNLLQEDP